MTTIAVNKYQITCDLQFTQGNLRFKGTTKVMEVPLARAKELFGAEKAFVGVSGETNRMGEIWSWLSKTSPVPNIEEGKTMTIALTNNGIYYSSNLHNWDKIEQDYYAIGSGQDFALGALASGKTTEEAIAIATELDIYTGLGYKTYTL